MYSIRHILRNHLDAVIVSTVLSGILLLLIIIRPDADFFQQLLINTCKATRGAVTIFCYFCIAVLLFLLFSKYGKIKFGGEDAKPEYSTFSWLSCLFMAGCGIGIVFYCQEPVLHYYNNPYTDHVEGNSIAVAYSLTLFNWTINDWVQFALLGIIIAYFHYNKHMELRVSSMLPAGTPNLLCRLTDMLMALGIISGLTTSLGLGVTQIERGLNYVFDIKVSPYLLMFVIGCIGTWSVVSGLKKGVKWLSNISMVMVSLLMAGGIILVGLRYGFPYLAEYIGSGSALLFRNYFAYNDFYNIDTSEWAASYPIFFNLWFAAWAAFVAVFIAKISKGRTIREFIIGVVGFPTLFTILWFGIFGSLGAEHRELIYRTMSHDVPTALFIFFNTVVSHDVYMMFSCIALLSICLFFITSSDSGSYVVASLVSRDSRPNMCAKLFWAMVQCLVAMVLFWCGGLALIQSVSVIMGLVVMLLIVIGTISLINALIRRGKN